MVAKHKEFIVPLDDTNQLRLQITTDQGQVVDFVVQYETLDSGRLVAVVRYDASHGHGHRDLLDGRGNQIEKRWMPEHYSLKQCLSEGEHDLRTNWRVYRERFLRSFNQ